MRDLAEKWAAVRQHLRDARTCVDVAGGSAAGVDAPHEILVGTVEEFEEFIDHNELELAWDALAAAAEKNNAPITCWRDLARAAALMGLDEKEKTARVRATPPISCDRALAIARQDAEMMHKDLSAYRIEIALEPDGWHIDYGTKDSNMPEGSPRYVVDSRTGTIISKRSER